ncbi:MAG: hypothetical protein R3C39_03440 [Dehalococcoidia bacterium]
MPAVTLIAELRDRGHRVGTAARRPAVLGAPASTVLVLGNGARVTIEGAPPLEVLTTRAAALDPQLALLLIEGFEEATDLATYNPPSEADTSTLAATIEATHLAPPSIHELQARAPIETERRLLDRTDFTPAPPPEAKPTLATRLRRLLGRQHR